MHPSQDSKETKATLPRVKTKDFETVINRKISKSVPTKHGGKHALVIISSGS